MLRHFVLYSLFFSVFMCEFMCELLGKYEGSKCSWKGVSGTCVNIFKCESAPFFLKEKEHPPICTFEGKEPIICCTDCETVEDTRQIVYNPLVGLLYLTGPRAKNECVHYIDKLDYDCKKDGRPIAYTREIDEEANCYWVTENSTTLYADEPGQPYMALLGFGDDINKAEWICAGAIISENFILTAAQCLTNSTLGPVRFIAVGIEKRTGPSETWQKYKVKRAIPYPEYKPPSKYHDIALLETEIPITFNEFVLPGCLDTGEADTDTASVIVYNNKSGLFFTNGLSGYDAEICSFFYPPQETMLDGFNFTTQDCYGNERPADFCQSDLGSALLGHVRESNCAQLLVGVTSIQRVCGTAASSGLYTQVVHYVPWIESIVWPS